MQQVEFLEKQQTYILFYFNFNLTPLVDGLIMLRLTDMYHAAHVWWCGAGVKVAGERFDDVCQDSFNIKLMQPCDDFCQISVLWRAAMNLIAVLVLVCVATVGMFSYQESSKDSLSVCLCLSVRLSVSPLDWWLFISVSIANGYFSDVPMMTNT